MRSVAILQCYQRNGIPVHGIMATSDGVKTAHQACQDIARFLCAILLLCILHRPHHLVIPTTFIPLAHRNSILSVSQDMEVLNQHFHSRASTTKKVNPAADNSSLCE